ncbi:MAG: hypothetical protein ACYCSA_03830 [Thermoplasmataceae archaeon]|jgi:hypothetical protein
MSLHIKRKRTLIYSSIVILILIFGVIFPVYNVYGFIFNGNPPITVQDGYYNVTYSGNFESLSNFNSFGFATNASRSTVTDANHPFSFLDVSLAKGSIYYNPSSASPENVLNIVFYLSISGHFSSNLHPKFLSISYGAVGSNQSSVILTTWAPPYSTEVPVAVNLSPDTLGNLALVGPGNVSVTTNLLNQSGHASSYNFYVSVMMWLTVKWIPNSSHTFDLSAQINGLSKPVNSTLSMTIVEMN